MSKFCSNGYVPRCQKDYSNLPWYERDIVSYIDHLKYREMRDEPDHYFKNVRMVNFGIINHECCGDKLQGTYRDYKTIKKGKLTNYPKEEAKVVFSVVFHNKRDDLWIKRDLMIKHFKENVQVIIVYKMI